ncbi:MAG: heat-inducible transcriptional repressor HrcA [Oscillospiraceae bacterium]|nr:heat-inducible transcriptional repressor HrcA [Oscillospiraceae bacterium]
MGIDERKSRVLRAIVSLYAIGGEPVGSSLLSKHLDLAVSTATLRNEMAALTRLGLLEQPHTSAGRVPSTAGYRYYLDNLMPEDCQLSLREKQVIDEIFEALDYDPGRLAKGAARALSELLGYSVVAATPKSEDMRIAHYELIAAGRYTVAVLAVTSAGGVLTRVARVPQAFSDSDLALCETLLNRALCFISPDDVGPAQLTEIRMALGKSEQTLFSIVNAAVTLLREAGRSSTYLAGQQYLLGWPELSDSLPDILELFADSERTQRLIIPRTDHVTVLLGEDLPGKPLPGLAIMSKRYLAGGGLTGAIAIAGPERMPYHKLISKLNYFALLLGRAMSGNKEEA